MVDNTASISTCALDNNWKYFQTTCANNYVKSILEVFEFSAEYYKKSFHILKIPNCEKVEELNEA